MMALRQVTADVCLLSWRTSMVLNKSDRGGLLLPRLFRSPERWLLQLVNEQRTAKSRLNRLVSFDADPTALPLLGQTKTGNLGGDQEQQPSLCNCWPSCVMRGGLGERQFY